MTMDHESAAAEKLAELEANAVQATGDTELMLRELDDLAARRRPNPTLERRYEALRATLAARLETEGPRYYLDFHGKKRYAYASVPEPIDVDVDELCRLDEAGELKEGVLDKVAPRKANKEEYRAAVKRGDITRQQFLATAKMTRGTPRVLFSDPDDDAS